MYSAAVSTGIGEAPVFEAQMQPLIPVPNTPLHAAGEERQCE